MGEGQKGQRGDLLAELAVDLPQELTPRERELFEELRRGGR
jgi:DnaJ-class molecular chaperone